MHWVESEIKTIEWSMKYTRKAMVAQVAVQVLNIAGIGWNSFELYHGLAPSASGFGLGAFISNFLWTGCAIAKYYGEYRDEKERLKYYKRLEMEGKIEVDREAYKQAKEFYETTYKNIMEEYLRSKPEGAQRLNTELFNATRFPNCS